MLYYHGLTGNIINAATMQNGKHHQCGNHAKRMPRDYQTLSVTMYGSSDHPQLDAMSTVDHNCLVVEPPN